MTDTKKSKARKPRVRKAPTLREQAEIARTKSENAQQPKKVRKITGKVGNVLGKSRVTRNPLVKTLARIGRFILKILRWLAPKYLVNSWREVKQVTWPTRKETWRLTLAVFVFAAIFGALVAGVDKGLDVIFKNVVLK